MKILGLNNFTSKNGDRWLVASGIQKWDYPEGKKGYQNCEHWFRNPDQAVSDKLQLGASVEVLYRKEGNRTVAFDVVEYDDDIDYEF